MRANARSYQRRSAASRSTQPRNQLPTATRGAPQGAPDGVPSARASHRSAAPTPQRDDHAAQPDALVVVVAVPTETCGDRKMPWRTSLPTVVIEIAWCEPRLKAAADRRPIVVGYQAVSRLCPLTITWLRKMPSKVNPNRSAALRDATLSESHFHSRRR